MAIQSKTSTYMNNVGRPPVISRRVDVITDIVYHSLRNLDGSNNGSNNAGNNIWLTNTEGSVNRSLTQVTSGAQSTNGIPLLDGRVIYGSNRNLDGGDASAVNAVLNIWIVNRDGTGGAALTQMTTGGQLTPEPNRLGTRIAYSSARNLDGGNGSAANAASNIWIINSDGTNNAYLTAVTAASVTSTAPSFSHDGTKIAFISNRNLNGTVDGAANAASNVWVMNVDGTGLTALTQITATGANCGSPTWSHDGTRITYTSLRSLDGNVAGTALTVSNIWLMNSDGSDSTPLTSNTVGTSSHPWYSPDDRVILYYSTRNVSGVTTGPVSPLNLWHTVPGVFDLPLTALTVTNGTSQGGTYSDNGGRIIFHSRRSLTGDPGATAEAGTNLWFINSDGTNPLPITRLTTNAGANLCVFGGAGGVRDFYY